AAHAVRSDGGNANGARLGRRELGMLTALLCPEICPGLLEDLIMAQKNSSSPPPATPEGPSSLSSAGGSLVALGTLFIVGSAITQERGWMLYAGIVCAILGAILWTLGG